MNASARGYQLLQKAKKKQKYDKSNFRNQDFKLNDLQSLKRTDGPTLVGQWLDSSPAVKRLDNQSKHNEDSIKCSIKSEQLKVKKTNTGAVLSRGGKSTKIVVDNNTNITACENKKRENNENTDTEISFGLESIPCSNKETSVYSLAESQETVLSHSIVEPGLSPSPVKPILPPSVVEHILSPSLVGPVFSPSSMEPVLSPSTMEFNLPPSEVEPVLSRGPVKPSTVLSPGPVEPPTVLSPVRKEPTSKGEIQYEACESESPSCHTEVKDQNSKNEGVGSLLNYDEDAPQIQHTYSNNPSKSIWNSPAVKLCNSNLQGKLLKTPGTPQTPSLVLASPMRSSVITGTPSRATRQLYTINEENSIIENTERKNSCLDMDQNGNFAVNLSKSAAYYSKSLTPNHLLDDFPVYTEPRTPARENFSSRISVITPTRSVNCELKANEGNDQYTEVDNDISNTILQQEEAPTMSIIQETEIFDRFLQGSVDDVFYYVCSSHENFKADSLNTYYFISPSCPALMLRIAGNENVKLNHIKNFCKSRWTKKFENSIISFKGKQVVDESISILNYRSNSTFLIFEEVVPQEHENHGGLLFQCSEKNCSKCYVSLKVYNRNHKHHQSFFQKELEKKGLWGRTDMDRAQGKSKEIVLYGKPNNWKKKIGSELNSKSLLKLDGLNNQTTSGVPSLGVKNLSSKSVRKEPSLETSSTSKPTVYCVHCEYAAHKCGQCKKEKCRMYHLDTFDDGDSFVCNECNSNVTGILGRPSAKTPTLDPSSRKQKSSKVHASGSKPSSTNAQARKSQRNLNKSKPHYKEEKSDSENDCSDEECKEPESDYNSSDDELSSRPENGKITDKSKRKVFTRKTVKSRNQSPGGRKHRDTYFVKVLPETDAETDEDEVVADLRKSNKLDLNKQIEEILMNPPPNYHLFIPDEDDKNIVDRYVVAPCNISSELMTHQSHLIPTHIIEKQKRGELPVGANAKDSRYWSKTGSTNKNAFIKLMGYIQMHIYEINPTFDPNLPHLKKIGVDNHAKDVRKLCLNQFFAFKENDFLELPDIRSILEKYERNENSAISIVNSYDQFCASVKDWVLSPDGLNQFMGNKYPKEVDMDFGEFQDVARSQRRNAAIDIESTQGRIKSNKFYGRMKGKIHSNVKINTSAKEKFMGESIPNNATEVVSKWHSHPDTQEMNKIIVNLVNSNEVPDGKTMEQISHHILLSETSKNGFRVQIWSLLTYGDFVGAMKSQEFSAYPYSQVHKQSGVDEEMIKDQIITDKDGDKIYVRPSPSSPDPNDPRDPMRDLTSKEWELVKGKCCTVYLTKNGRGMPQHVFFSRMGEFYFKLYEEIRARYLRSIGQDPTELSKPLIVNARYLFSIEYFLLIHVFFYSGNQFVNNNGLDLSLFCRRVEIAYQTHHFFRKMCVRKAYDANNLFLREYEQFALCHTQSVAVDKYLGMEYKKVKALVYTSWYRDQLNIAEEQVSIEKEDFCVSAEQKERFREGALQQADSERSLWLSRQEEKDKAVRVTLDNVVGDLQKSAFIKCCIRATEENIEVTSRGSLLEIFFSGARIKKKDNTILVMRMLTILPKTWPSLQILENNLIDFVKLIALQNESPRSIQINWTEKICEQIDRLRTIKHLNNPNITMSFTSLAKKYGDKFLMGNINIIHQMKHCLQQDESIENVGQKQSVVSANHAFEEFNKEMHRLKRNDRDVEENQCETNACKKQKLSIEEENLEKNDTSKELSFTAVTEEENEIRELVSATIKINCKKEKLFNGHIVKTPKKENRAKVTLQNDKIKIQLLSQYLEKTSNPLLKEDEKMGFKPALRLQCLELRNGVRGDKDWIISPQKISVENGETYYWRQICQVESMVDIMYRKGFQDQGDWRKCSRKENGLFQLIEDYIKQKKVQNPTPACMKRLKLDIVNDAEKKFLVKS